MLHHNKKGLNIVLTQVEFEINAHLKHWVWGFPAHPTGHLQTSRWTMALHSASLPQGFWEPQRLVHWWEMHAWLSKHSESRSQSPTFANEKDTLMINTKL